MGSLFKYAGFLAVIGLSIPVFASVTLSGSELHVDESGAIGGIGGAITMNLAYADAAKTQVQITINAQSGQGPETYSKTLPLAQLKGIHLKSVGDDGTAGGDGQGGYDGGAGQAGCPPGNGGNGSDGGDGGNGTDGSDGGAVTVKVPANQSELLLLVTIHNHGGSGGAGGSGGQGGSGGNGGDSTCDDYAGGSGGYAGSNGADGSRGADGSTGAKKYVTTNGKVETVYASPFKLSLSSVQVIDDNEDGILQPGEKLHVLAATITNQGDMPTPTGQAIAAQFVDSARMQFVSSVPIATNQMLAAGASTTLTFKKGDIVLQALPQPRLIGTPAALDAIFSIHSLTSSTEVSSGMVINSPIWVASQVVSPKVAFDIPTILNFSLVNTGSQPLGPKGDQTFDLTLSWTSTTIGAQDVTVTLPDGRAFGLANGATISDLSVPAKTTLALPLTVAIRDAKAAASGQGSLAIGLKVPDQTSHLADSVQILAQPVTLNLDYKDIVINQTVDLTAAGLQCAFKNRGAQVLPINSVQISKVKGSTQVKLNLSTPSSPDAPDISPTITITDAGTLPYLENLTNPSVDPSLTLTFFKKWVVPDSPSGTNSWRLTGCSF